MLENRLARRSAAKYLYILKGTSASSQYLGTLRLEPHIRLRTSTGGPERASIRGHESECAKIEERERAS